MAGSINFIVSNKSFEKFMMMTILGTTGAAMDKQMNFFFTFWGLKLITKRKQRTSPEDGNRQKKE